MNGNDIPPIVIVRKKAPHHGHHGGAWKVAYADFVTAMMAFFMVLWLMNSNQKIQEAVGAYFRDPAGKGRQSGTSVLGQGESLEVSRNNMDRLKNELERMMKTMPDFQQLKDHVTMTVTGEGLRIELLETEKGMFFESGSTKPSRQGEELLVVIAKELGNLPNNLLIEGHTDARPYSGKNDYTNWELSVDRANASRKLMESNGLRSGQVAQVRGFADRCLRIADDPTHASNRRVSVIVKYLDRESQDRAGDNGD